jgi:hypothetical protein
MLPFPVIQIGIGKLRRVITGIDLDDAPGLVGYLMLGIIKVGEQVGI